MVPFKMTSSFCPTLVIFNFVQYAHGKKKKLNRIQTFITYNNVQCVEIILRVRVRVSVTASCNVSTITFSLFPVITLRRLYLNDIT